MSGVAQAGTDVAPGQSGFEPHIATVNPRNPAQVAVMRGCQVRISNDFGRDGFPIVRNTTQGCNGDPVLAWDSQSRLFVTHLDRVGAGNELTVFAGRIVDTTTTGTMNYTPTQVSTINGSLDDKQWLVADANPNSPFADNLYLVWTEFASPSRVMFSRSTNGGATWSAPAQVSQAGEGFVWPSHAAVGANGDVYVAYHTHTCEPTGLLGTVQLLRDGTGGAAFEASTVPQRSTVFGPGQATVTCNRQDSSGDEVPGADFWLQGSAQPWILPDPARAGMVYVVGNDDPNNMFASGDDANVVIARSNDFGSSFGVNRVDHGPGQSFAVMPSAHIDQDGRITVTWYDNRRLLQNTGTSSNNGAANFLLDLYATTSNDGGQSFVDDFRVNDAPFDPDANANCRFGSLATNDCTVRIGEYNGVWTVDGIGYAVWTGNATPPGAPFPSSGGGAQTTMFDVYSMIGAYRDAFEPNESRDFAVVSALGSDDAYNQGRLSLHSDADIDFFKVIANRTGALDIEAAFNEVLGDVRVRALDEWGNVVATGISTAAQVGSSVNGLTIPVVQGGNYFLEVSNPGSPDTFPAQNVYDLTVVNRAAPVPLAIDLRPDSDSGLSDSDDLTNDATPTITARVDVAGLKSSGIAFSPTNDNSLSDDAPGYKVRLYADGNPVGFGSPVMGKPGTFEVTLSSALTDGVHLMTARTLIVDPSDTPGSAVNHLVAAGPESAALQVRIDTTAPGSPAAPDLLNSSDTAGINTDDVTTLQAPTLQGTAEAGSLVHLLLDGNPVNQQVTSTTGAWKITTQSLGDAVYAVTVEAEDAAGNLSATSDSLRMIVANQVLNLTGALAATGDVSTDLNNQTITPFPVPGGVVGIRGIPTVNMGAGGAAVAVTGTPENDRIDFTPTTANAGSLTRDGTAQLLRILGIDGNLTVDPLDGTDSVGIVATAAPDQIAGMVDTLTTLQVDSLKALRAPTANTENFQIESGAGADTMQITALDTVSAYLSVAAGNPTAAPKKVGDELTVIAGSTQPHLNNAPGGSSPGAGMATVSYPKTTGNAARIDYSGVERVRLIK